MNPQEPIDSLNAEIARLRREKGMMFVGFYFWTMAIGSLVARYFDANHIHAGMFVGFAAASGGVFGGWLMTAIASLRDYIARRRSLDNRMHQAFFKDNKSDS